jgi:hypothetical protein
MCIFDSTTSPLEGESIRSRTWSDRAGSDSETGFAAPFGGGLELGRRRLEA